MKIEPVPTDFRQVSSASFLEIPQFQRPYSWSSENIDEYWNDLIGASGGDYFIGSSVFFKKKNDPSTLYITDGQQRFTTITITLCAIRDICFDCGLSGIANGIQNFIQRKDVEDKTRFFIKYGNGNIYFPNCILSTGERKVKPTSDEEKAQARAFELIKQRIVGNLNEVLGEYWRDSDKLEANMRSLRDSVFGLKFIQLTLDNEDDAYIVFETLNSRGKDLQVSDLLKNHFSKNLKNHKDKDQVSVVWDKIRGAFEGLSSATSFDAFLLHYWLATQKNVSKKELFKSMKKAITKADAPLFLWDIFSAASSYELIASPDDNVWQREEKNIYRSLAAINRFGVQQARPLLLSIIRQYEEDGRKIKQINRSLSLIENFAFQFNAITQSRGGGGIGSMYAALARECHVIESAQMYSDFNRNLQKKFEARFIERDDFIVAFRNLYYTKDETRDRGLIRYILSRLHAHFSKKTGCDYDDYTIEHLEPQSSGQDFVGYIGNLAFVPSKLNNSLGNKSFVDKKEALIDAGHLDPFAAAWDKVSESNVRTRGQRLAEAAFDIVWKI